MKDNDELIITNLLINRKYNEKLIMMNLNES